ncbi:MAG: tRNA-dihydrouridine synthase [Candidatus Aenigmatarchaeota archaeon]
MDISATICGLKIDPAWMNGSGVLSQPPIIKRISAYDMGAFVTKSTGLHPRNGFYEPVVYHDIETLNCIGLANPGIDETLEELEEIYPLTKNKPLVGSVFGENEYEFVGVATKMEKYCDAIELNFGCPNLKEGEKKGMTIGRDPDLVRLYTKAVKDKVRKPVIAKLTPNVYDIGVIAKAAEEAGADAISAINTVFPATKLDITSGAYVLANKNGGLSGPPIKSIGIAAVRKIYDSVKVPIIGGGGITTVDDIIEYYRAGSSCVSIGTAVAGKNTEEVGIYFKDLKNRLEDRLERMGASCLRELTGVRI